MKTVEEMKCDFCSRQPVVARLPASDFTVGPLVDNGGDPLFGVSEGDWMACAVCGHLIMFDEWEKLQERINKSFLENAQLVNNAAKAVVVDVVLRSIYQRFRENWNGEVIWLDKGEDDALVETPA